MPFKVEFSPDAVAHVDLLSARERALVLDRVEEQLRHQPGVPTRNRKPLRPNSLATWELRVGKLRIYYDVDLGLDPLVLIVAVGVKDRNVVRIAGKEFEL